MIELKLNKRSIGVGYPTFIIAEAGLNHNADYQIARELIAAAAESGADAVKFQTFDTDEFILPSSPYYSIFKNSELPRDDFSRLKEYADSIGILFLSTPFDMESADYLDQIGVSMFKIASCDLTNIPLVRHIARKNKPILLSTGMASMHEVFQSLDSMQQEGNNEVGLFHCIAHYPAKEDEMNLRAIPYMAEVFQRPIGLSDHTLGISIPNASVALGANMIEKHFTLDKEMAGPDHQLSATPDEMREMVKVARSVESALGSYGKIVPESDEHKNVLRRSLTARVDIPTGVTLTQDMICIKRPGDGLPPELMDSIVGRQSKVAIEKNQQLNLRHLE